MGDELIVVRRFTDRVKAELVRQRLVDQGVRCEVTSTRTDRTGRPTEFGILLDRDRAGHAIELLGPEPRPDAVAIRRGERALQVALGLGGLIAIIWLAVSLMRG